MAQVSYGTITITDTNDIESIIVEYNRNQSTTTPPAEDDSGWSTSRPAWAQGYYIWQRTRIHKTGTQVSADTFGTAVCLTGSTGQTGQTGATGQSLSSTKTQYTNVASNVTITTSNHTNYTWTDNVPTYNSSKPVYWGRITNTYINPAKTEYLVYKDQGTTDAIKTSNDANTTADNAWNKADNAEDIAQQASDDVETLTTTYNTFINTQAKYFVRNSTGSIVIGSRENESTPVAFDVTNVSTYGYNSLMAPSQISLRYNDKILSSWSSSALTFYKPSTSSQGAKAMELTSSALKFYNPTNDSISMMDLTSTGLTFKTAAGATIGTFGSDSSGGLLDLSGRLNIKGGGRIGQDSTNYWEFGDNAGYNVSKAAYLLGRGNTSIQLGENGHWRIDKNRIHTGWYVIGDSSSSTPAGSLHFDTYNVDRTSTSSGDQFYWDYGIHFPISNTTPLNNKFLYARYSKTTVATTTLSQMKGRIDNDDHWYYRFYVDDLGNVHSPSYYIINDDGSEQTLSGSGLIASSLSCGTVGSLTQPVYFNNGVPATTTYALNAAGAKGVVTDIANNASSADLPTTAAVVSYVTSRGYITSYTDYRVKTEARGSTTMYLAGSNTSETVSQGTLLTDSGVYIQTSSSSTNLVVPKVNGYTLAAASAKGVDTSIAAASTSTNLPTSKAVAAFVEGKGYKTTDNNTTYSLTQDSNDGHKITLTPSSGNAQTVTIPDNNTTYTFANGTNGFTVTPSGGEAQTVTVTPSISNNIIGSGTRTSGYLAKFSGTNTITNGPALGTDTTKFLNNKGEWAVPAGTYTYTLPLATSSARGGVQIGYTQSGKNYPVQLSSEKMYVNVPWENTTYSAGTGLSLSGTTFNHSNSVTAGTAGTSSATSSTNRTIDIPYVTYDAQGHVTGSGTHTHTLSSFPEAYLSWGGRNFSGGYGCIDAAMIDVLGANRFAFLKAAGLTIEYSTDGGSNWTDYGATNIQKTGLFGAGQSFHLGKATAKANNTVNNQLRVTIDTGAASIYTVLNKIAIYMSTAGNTVQVLIEKALQSTPTTYSTHLNWTGISGWSGWNILNISELTTYGNTAASQYGRVRFTFKQTAINSNYPSANISRIMGFGGVGWTVPSNMARDGHLYSYDNSQNATFPAQVTATQFNGTATGNITSVQYDSTNKKITYTKNSTNTDVVTVATLKTDLGSMPASDVYSWAKASTKPSYSYSEIGSAPDAIVDATVNSQGVIVLTKNSGGTVTLSTEIAVVESQGANKLVEAGSTTGINVGSSDRPVYFSSGIPVVGYYIPKLNGSNQSSAVSFYAPTAAGTAKQILVSSGSGAPTWQTVATGGTNGTIKIGSDEYSVKGLAAAAYKTLADSSSASAIGTGTNVTTERDVYYGLPTINNAHNYTSSTTIYAPTAGGTSSQVLIGNGTTSAPVWTDISGLVPASATNATNATNDSDGNPINTTYIKKSIGTAAGDIIYWSASGTPTRLAKGSNGQVLKLADGVPTWGTDNNTWNALSTSQAGYVAKAPNDTAKFLRGDASWAAVTKSNVGLGSVDNTADADKRVKGANITTTANAVAYYTDTAGTFGSKASANGALYATSANGSLNWGTLPVAQGGTGKTTALAAITNLGGAYILAQGTEITASSNLDSGYKTMGTYYSPDSTRSNTLAGTCPFTGSGFKMITAIGYRGATIRQFAGGASNNLYYRSSQDTGSTWTKWYELVLLPSGSDNKTFAAIGSSTQPVYVNSSGVVTACTSYANATVGKSNKTGSADLTTTANAIAYYTDTAGTFGSKASANGALYATSANGALNWGTLPVAQGGTGATTFTSGALLIGNGTSAVGTRTIKNMTAKGNLGWTAAATDIYIPTINTMAYWNGAYSGTSSNLTYCNQGAFGTAATYTATTSITSGGTGLPTAGAVYTAINNLSSSYVSLNGNEGILGTKVFGSGTSYGTVTNKTTYTEKANINYDSTLEAIVFSFA